MLLSLLLILASDPASTDAPPSPARPLPPLTVIPSPCDSGFIRLDDRPRIDGSIEAVGVSRYLLLDRRDARGCPAPIRYLLPDQPRALGRELGREVPAGG